MNLKLNFQNKKHMTPGTYNHIIIRKYCVSERPAGQKDKVTGSLINQFSEQNNYPFQKRNTENKFRKCKI